MNLRRTLRGASIFATLFCFWMQPAAAQQEIKLTKSITILPDRPSGIEMIFKSAHNEHNGRDRSQARCGNGDKSPAPQRGRRRNTFSSRSGATAHLYLRCQDLRLG